VKEVEKIIEKLKQLQNKKNKDGQARFGINTANSFGISIPVLRNIAKDYKNNHALALALWQQGYHEARILACFIDNYKEVSEAQMEQWVLDFNSWDLCDQCCGNLFDKTEWAYQKANEWSHREEEYVRRAGFVMMACLAVHDKKATDKDFMPFFKLIEQYAFDERNFVKKAVNWALRQIGKRNEFLKEAALTSAKKIQQQSHKSSKWIAADAIRELEKVKPKR
jgi:3-methyladenine DNA glycosylase AlkD